MTAPAASGELARFLDGFSIEVMPRTAAKIADFSELLPPGTRIYIAHIEGTPFDQMLATAKRLSEGGFRVMPHFTARAIGSRRDLAEMIAAYRGEAGVEEALVLAGGMKRPAGEFDCSSQLLETHLFDEAGFARLHVAGHPEGNADIDPDGGSRNLEEALLRKQEFARNSDAAVELTTQFAFEASPVLAWAERLAEIGVSLPINVGLAGPTKLQTLLKFAIECGVGPSLRVLKRRAADIGKLLQPVEPTELAREFARHVAARPDAAIKGIHLFPLGGIAASARWAQSLSASSQGDA